MRDEVRADWCEWTRQFEGLVLWPYPDILGLVTIAFGDLIDPIDTALGLPFTINGVPATREQIGAGWLAVKGRRELAQQGYRAAEYVSALRLSVEDAEALALSKLDEMAKHLLSRFPEFEDWPADAQRATLSMAWACGPGFHFPILEGCLHKRDWTGAAANCTINETGNPGLIPRNKANRALYLAAATPGPSDTQPVAAYVDQSDPEASGS